MLKVVKFECFYKVMQSFCPSISLSPNHHTSFWILVSRIRYLVFGVFILSTYFLLLAFGFWLLAF